MLPPAPARRARPAHPSAARPTPHAARRRISTGLVSALAALVGLTVLAGPAHADNVVTPGNFTGFGFDQCTAPTQTSMTRWLQDSPYFAVGIYISGASRGCRSQPNLTSTWVANQLRVGWRLLPITLGPQANCSTRFPRYGNDPVISASSASTYATARSQGATEASTAVTAAKALGIKAGSTLWYDLEAFDTKKSTACTNSAIYFVHAWTNRLHALGYVSGFYSSAASGIRMLDDARVNQPKKWTLPDRIWIADWNGVADTNSTYIRSDGWQPHLRVHQYQGGHNERYAGTTINIDANWLDLGTGSNPGPAPKHCGGIGLDFPRYAALRKGSPSRTQVRALKCLLTEKKLYAGGMGGLYTDSLTASVKKWQARAGLPVSSTWSTSDWVSLLIDGSRPVTKRGSAGDSVRRIQRALNAAGPAQLPITGLVDYHTQQSIKGYQNRLKMTPTGVVAPSTWARLLAGKATS